MKKHRTISTTESSANILVIKRDQKPDGKYVIINNLRIETSGSDRVIISGVKLGSAVISVSILPPKE